MRRNHAQEDPIEGFDTSELPPIGPQGIQGAEDRRLPVAPPRLCEVGPCVHYHRFQIQLDVEAPKASAIEPGGKMAGDGGGQPFHVRTHHYCYPDAGIETELGSLPVMECNRWEPILRVTVEADKEANRRFFAEDPRGIAYRTELAAWTAASEQAMADLEHDEVATWVSINLRDGDIVNVCETTALNQIADMDEPCSQCGAPAGGQCTPAKVTVTPHLGDAPREIEIPSECAGRPRKPGTGWYRGLETLDDDTARAFLSMPYLKERYGGQTVRLEIWRKGPEPVDYGGPGAINVLTVEVK